MDGKGALEREVADEEKLPPRPSYGGPWEGWQNWGGLEIANVSPALGEKPYYRWSDGSPATEKFDFCGKIGPDGQGFVQRDGKIYRIQFDLLSIPN